mmetsp:Transcript_98992/g.229340  ORF Transcript_98992/g.229340 Transcript_98992/m.229340 type:complete len:242 (+) Transcript_98992:670-1395(+)
MHALLAVVDVPGLPVILQDALQSGREEDRVWINLHCPIMLVVAPIFYDLSPYLDEDPRVECLAKVASRRALQVAVDDRRSQAADLKGPVTIDHALVARKDAGTVRLLRFQELHFLTAWSHKREAVERNVLGALDFCLHLQRQPLRGHTRDDAVGHALASGAATFQEADVPVLVGAGVFHPAPYLASFGALAQGTTFLRADHMPNAAVPDVLVVVKRVLDVGLHVRTPGVRRGQLALMCDPQ